MLFVVRSEADLKEFLRLNRPPHPFRRSALLIRIPELSESEALAWERRLENLRQQCGCTAGAIALGAFVLLFSAYSLRNNLLVTEKLPLGAFALQGGLFVGGLILSATIGKFLALWVATVRFRRTCFELYKRLQTTQAGRF